MKNRATSNAVDDFRQLLFDKGYFGRAFKSDITYARDGYPTQVGVAETWFDGDTQSGDYGRVSIEYFADVTKESGHYVLFNPHYCEFRYKNGCLTIADESSQPGREGAYTVEIRPL